MSSPPFSRPQRDRIVREIARWRCEFEATNGDRYPRDDLAALISNLRQLEDAALKKSWMHTVGEWVASRSDVVSDPDQSFDEWLQEQFEAVCAGEPRQYDFIIDVRLPVDNPSV